MPPISLDLYDREDGVVLSRDAITAHEAVINDPARYTLTRPAPWPPVTPSAPAAAAVPAAVESGGSKTPAGAEPPENPGEVESHELERVKGIGPAMSQALQDVGIHSLPELAQQTPEGLAELLKMEGLTAARIEKQGWISQAQELTATPAE